MMMNDLQIEPTSVTPRVDFRAGSGAMTISGDSYPENAFEFFEPLIAWIDRFVKERPDPVHLDVTLSYLNTSSIKCLVDILDMLEEAHGKGRAVRVHWFYEPENDRALDMAEEFKEDISFPFTVVPLAEET
jgi:hypothetical protein